MIKVLHIITSLDGGGAENMLNKIIMNTDHENYYHHIVSLKDKGIYGDNIESHGVQITCLNLTLKNLIPSVLKVRKISNEYDIINTWLYHSDFFGFLIAKFFSKKKLIWNIRQANINKDANTKVINIILRVNAFLSKKVDLITYNSNSAYLNHIDFGFKAPSKIVPNGFDLNVLQFSSRSRNLIREHYKIGDKKIIITVGRWDIQKDYQTLIDALEIIARDYDNYMMVFVGKDLDSSNESLRVLIENANLQSHVILLGRQENIPSLLSAADIYVSSSLGESFSNSIGEAMSCELTCVVTDVGDSKLLVGKTGIVVPSQDSNRLAIGISQLLEEKTTLRNKKAREVIEANYEIKHVTRIYESIYADIINSQIR